MLFKCLEGISAKKIIALLAIVALSFSAKAGSVTINNSTGNTYVLQALNIAQFSPPGSFWFTMSGPAFILPGSSTYASVDAFITAMGGPTTGFGASTHFLQAMVFMDIVTGCSPGSISAGAIGTNCGVSFTATGTGALQDYTINIF